MRGRDVTFRGLCEAIGIAGILVVVFGLGEQDKEAAPSLIARLDDLLSPAPALVLAYENTGAGPDFDNLSGLGSTADPAEEAVLDVTDEPAAPLKLRRIQVVRLDRPVPTTALRALTQNTSQRARRATRAIPAIVKAVVARYGTVISQAGRLHNVPAQLIATKISIENPDLLAAVVTGGQATGIMQIAPQTADSVLRSEYKAGNLLPAEIAYFRTRLGAARWATLLAGKPVHTVGLLQNAAYNIHVGTLAFGQYLRKYTDAGTGEVQVFKAAAEYNRGPRAQYANARCNTPDELIAFKGPGKTSTPATTQQYVMLYCGPGGPLDYLTANDLLT